jgi:aryl-alcohol dehydrogenase-like predicted oxidoreductase
MEMRTLGKTGLKVSTLGYGAGAVGGLMTKGAAADQERAIARAVELGINYVDTASIYGNGESERNLGRVLKTLKPDIVLGTKVRLVAGDRGHVGAAIERELEGSLRRLGRDYVDLYQLHNPLSATDAGDRLSIDIAMNEVMPVFERLKREGKIRFFGFSAVGETAAFQRAIGSKAFDTAQIVYNALNPSAGGPLPSGAPGQDYERLFDHIRAANMGVIVIRALAGGALSGSTARHPLAMQEVAPIGSGKDLAVDAERARKLEPLLAEGAAGSLAELAMRFTIGHPTVSTMLVGYSTLDHLEQAAAAVNKGPLPEAVLKRIAGG